MSLTRAVGAAVDRVFGHQKLRDFAKLQVRDGFSFRRYYRATPASECEIWVHRDKRWARSGGRVFVELFCLVAEVQRLLGGCAQSWLAPDHGAPLEHFQYRLDRDAQSNEWQVVSNETAADFGRQLHDFLLSRGLAWFGQFETRAGVIAYLQAQERYLSLSELHAHLENRDQALAAFERYLRELPRQIEGDLRRVAATGLISEDERRVLSRACIQSHSDYANEVRKWCQQRER